MESNTQINDENDRPKWLLELENRKRKPRLAHEVGAGAPCTKCNDSCPGLDLHFWRKICKNCKCGRDDHDVPDDEFPQFDLLFGPTGKAKRKLIVLKLKDQQTENEETFEWVPPDTTKELAADYMKALPEDKLPIKGSAGAALRKQQLQKQLPLHDIDHKVCDELTESERRQFEKYLENLKKYAGQGKVLKVMGARPFDKSLMTPANASECFSPKHRPNLSSGNLPNLRTPSSFVPKSNYSTPLGSHEKSFNSNHIPNPSPIDSQLVSTNFSQKSQYSTPIGVYEGTFCGNQNRNTLINGSQAPSGNCTPISNYSTPYGHQEGISHTNENSNVQALDSQAVSSRLENIRRPLFNQSPDESAKIARYHHVLANMKNESELAGFSNVPGIYNPPMYFPTTNKLPQDETYSSILQVNEPCEIPGEISEVRNHRNDIEKIPEYSSVTESSQIQPQISGISSSISQDRAHNPTLNFAQSNLHDDNIPKYLNSRPHLSQLQKVKGVQSENSSIVQCPSNSQQWSSPLKDTSETFSKSQYDENFRLADKMLSEALLPPSAIHSSDIIGSSLDEKELSRIREKLSAKYSAKDPTEPGTSVKSRELGHVNADDRNNPTILSDLNNPNLNSKPFHAQFANYKTPENSVIRSESLHNPIFPEQAVGTSRIMENPGVDRLGSVLENLSIYNPKVQKCHQCQGGISVGDVVVTAEKANDAVWHPGCFVCSCCNELLVDLVYFYYKEKLYCARDLASLLEIPRCFACDELIFVREYTVAEGHNYHVKHFCCWDCDIPLAGQQYISENDRPLCLPCYQKTYAKACSACHQVIAADQQGVAVKNLNFHASDECFCCVSCKKSLLNGRMAIKEDKPFCSKDCISMYRNQNKN